MGMYCPPWRLRLSDSRVGPEYGPRSPGLLDNAHRAFEESIYGGGLWDPDEPTGYTTVALKRRLAETAARADQEVMEKYVTKHASSLPTREVEIFLLYWIDRKSVGFIAK